MDWKTIIEQLQVRGLSLQEIGDAVGLSKGGVHRLVRVPGSSVVYETGVRLIELHEKIMVQSKKVAAKAARKVAAAKREQQQEASVSM